MEKAALTAGVNINEPGGERHPALSSPTLVTAA